jgi:thiopeptide-type bacteriocin biosynthesis protein
MVHLRAEEQLRPDAVFAEIVHLPSGRAGNVVLRPVLRDWELPFLGRSGASRDRQLPLTDLMVSVRDSRIVLRSARLGREIVPRLSTAHNYRHASNLTIYRFLCALQDQGVATRVGWPWGPLSNAPFLPRVVVGRAVLARASWNLDAAALRPLAADDTVARFQALRALRAAVRLPRFVAVEDGDTLLPFDLDNVLGVETLAQLAKQRTTLRLVEISAPDALCARGPDGRFVHELLVPFLRARPTQQPAPIAQRLLPLEKVRRSFVPGSQWLYAKIYCGSNAADELLRHALPTVIASATRSGAAERWFFLRYADPDWHLRLRFEGAPTRLYSEVLPALHAALEPFVDDGRVARLQLDSYTREVERYGGDGGVLLAERLFHVDSEAVLALLPLLDGDDARWRLALAGTDRLLEDFGFTLPEKQRIATHMRDQLRREHGNGVALIRSLGEKFRRERARVGGLLAGERGVPSAAIGQLERRSALLAPIAGELRRRSDAGQLSLGLEPLASSCVHMSINRLLRTAIRAQELVLYDFLTRLYESQAARLRDAPPTLGAMNHDASGR